VRTPTAFFTLFLTPVLVSAAEPVSRPARLSVLDRLLPGFLERFERDRSELVRRAVVPSVPYPFIRGTFHMHSELSHDSRGTVAEIIAAAKATGTKVVGFTEHPRPDRDVVADNVKGWRDGVFFLAGTESHNVLHWPAIGGEADLRFLSHVEELSRLDGAGFDGMEIYNTHSDAKDEPIGSLLAGLLLNLPAVQAHPQAAFAALLDYPAEFLARYDRITAEAPFAGIAANDSHRNQRFRFVGTPQGTVEALDDGDEIVWRSDGLTARALIAAFGHKGVPRQRVVLTDVLLDPYEVSMRHVGTFLQTREVTEATVRHALRTGRIIVGFESVAPLPAVGFWVEQDGKPVGTVGDRIRRRAGLSLKFGLPLAADVRLIRNGRVIQQARGAAGTWPEVEAGVYRLEAFLELAGERYPWVLTNPIYIE